MKCGMIFLPCGLHSVYLSTFFFQPLAGPPLPVVQDSCSTTPLVFTTFRVCLSPKTTWFLFSFYSHKEWKFYLEWITFHSIPSPQWLKYWMISHLWGSQSVPLFKDKYERSHPGSTIRFLLIQLSSPLACPLDCIVGIHLKMWPIILAHRASPMNLLCRITGPKNMV